MKNLLFLILCTFVITKNAVASTETMECPAKSLLPKLDYAYHECSNGYANGSCDEFVRVFEELIPEYNCQRSFDNAPVPAIWLAGSAPLEDYIELIYHLAINKDGFYDYFKYDRAKSEAKRMFTSDEFFLTVIDGALAEEYGPLVIKLRENNK